MSKRAKRWTAIAVTVAWGVGYIVAILQHEPSIAAAATPLAFISTGYLLGHISTSPSEGGASAGLAEPARHMHEPHDEPHE